MIAPPAPMSERPEQLRTLVLVLGAEDYRALDAELRRRRQLADEERLLRSDDPDPESNPAGAMIADVVRDLDRMRNEALVAHPAPPATPHTFPEVSGPMAHRYYRRPEILLRDVKLYLGGIAGGDVGAAEIFDAEAVRFLWGGLTFWFVPLRTGAEPPSAVERELRKLVEKGGAIAACVRSVADVQAVLQASSFTSRRSRGSNG
jgi:hypothetical protein